MARHDASAARRLRLRLSYGHLTVRQLQKLLSRAATGFDRAVIRDAKEQYFPEVPLDSLPTLLARLAARYGPDTLLAEAVKREARPKGTDEVAPATQQEDGDLHGGDGASGEVDHPVPQIGEVDHPVPQSGEGEVEHPLPQSGEGEVEHPLPQSGKERYRSPRRSPEAFASLSQADAPPPDEVRRVRAAMAQLIAFGGQGETSPRWDTSELVKRLISRRPLWPARRDEEGRPSILVLPDVSGSCYAIARESLRLARAVALLGVPGAEVLIVSHVNGQPHEIQVGTSALRKVRLVEVSADFAVLTSFYQRLIKTYMVEAVVAVGDSDAEDVYSWLAGHPAISRLVWLDNSFCRQLERPRRSPLTRWPAPARQKTTRLVGCKRERFAEALELALRA